jgi:HTH-type transcriptional regulator / antitoxin HigA
MSSDDGKPSPQLKSLGSRTLMNNAQPLNFEPNAIPHPGETVLEYLDFYGWSQRDLSRRTGLTPKTISEICNGKAPISPPTALAFEKAFQRPAHLWLNLQRDVEARFI